MSLVANFEVRLDQLGERGLWLEAHYYDADPNYRDSSDGETPVARRKREWFTLASLKYAADMLAKTPQEETLEEDWEDEDDAYEVGFDNSSRICSLKPFL